METSRARYSSGSESHYAISRQRRKSASSRASKVRNSRESRSSAYRSHSDSSLQRGIVKERDMRKSHSAPPPVTHPSIDKEVGKRASVYREISNIHEETTYSSVLERKATIRPFFENIFRRPISSGTSYFSGTSNKSQFHTQDSSVRSTQVTYPPSDQSLLVRSIVTGQINLKRQLRRVPYHVVAQRNLSSCSPRRIDVL
jgi:hypothetical protein